MFYPAVFPSKLFLLRSKIRINLCGQLLNTADRRTVILQIFTQYAKNICMISMLYNCNIIFYTDRFLTLLLLLS